MSEFQKGVLKFLAWVVGLAVVVGVILNFFFVDRIVIGHNGMAPTMFAGDEVLVWRSDSPSDMGDIVFCRNPQNVHTWVVARVVGKPGMQVGADDRGQFRIAGQSLDRDIFPGSILFEDWVDERTDEMKWGLLKLGNVDHLFFDLKDSDTRIPPHRVTRGLWLIGDNRLASGWDSRAFGEVLPQQCTGTVFMRLRPSDQTPDDLPNGWLDIID